MYLLNNISIWRENFQTVKRFTAYYRTHCCIKITFHSISQLVENFTHIICNMIRCDMICFRVHCSLKMLHRICCINVSATDSIVLFYCWCIHTQSFIEKFNIKFLTFKLQSKNWNFSLESHFIMRTHAHLVCTHAKADDEKKPDSHILTIALTQRRWKKIKHTMKNDNSFQIFRHTL